MKRLVLVCLIVVAVFAHAAFLYAQDEPTEAELIEIIMASDQPVRGELYLSQDGKWEVQLTIHDCALVNDFDEMAYEVLELVDKATDERHTIATQLRNCGGLGAFGLMTMSWSADNRYLYFTDAREGQPDGGVGIWLRPISRVDVTEMSFTALGGGLFSPSMELLAVWDAGEVAILQTSGDELARFEAHVQNGFLSNIFWLPDMSGLVYVLGDDYPPLTTRSYIVHIDLDTLEQTVLLDSGQ